LTYRVIEYKVFFMIIPDNKLVAEAANLLEAEYQLMSSLKALRKKRGISQAVVAHRMGVTQPAVAAFEHYDANPRMSSIRRYALAIGAQLSITVTETAIDPSHPVAPLKSPDTPGAPQGNN
jgi:transcriptional regulator with XRE-family HTH domain